MVYMNQHGWYLFSASSYKTVPSIVIGASIFVACAAAVPLRQATGAICAAIILVGKVLVSCPCLASRSCARPGFQSVMHAHH